MGDCSDLVIVENSNAGPGIYSARMMQDDRQKKAHASLDASRSCPSTARTALACRDPRHEGVYAQLAQLAMTQKVRQDNADADKERTNSKKIQFRGIAAHE